MASKRRQPAPWADDLFSLDPGSFVPLGLSRLSWPGQDRFPVNHAAAHVRDIVRSDLTGSDAPLLIAGYSSIAALVDFVACWRQARGRRPGKVRLLLGSEPFPSQRAHFMSPQEQFTDEVRGYWLEHSVSVRLSAKVIRAIAELDAGSLEVRVIPGLERLHAKIYVGQQAATVGSSNYTDFGLARQLEANARFEKAADPERYRELVTIADNYWSCGASWAGEFRRLLESLLRVVSWQEALARACAELLEGDWARHVLAGQPDQGQLWPSQRAGIAQALWVMENLGSVLVADATGSGKTRMGAHLVAAVRDRLLDTGRLRRDRDITTLVCPPAVLDTWRREALMCGVPMMPVSQGVLSRPDPDGSRIELAHVARAQVLAVDEAHNFLSADSNRTRHIRDSIADHVLLFTATPISRGAQDLLSLVSLLGADNFDDETLEILEQLDRGARADEAMTDQQRQRLRLEIQRFTVRRTKSALNDLVTQAPESYRDPASGRTCRYPRHEPRLYDTGESPSDEAAADAIRSQTESLLGVVQLGRQIRMPALFRGDVTDQQWLEMRLNAARGLARYQVLAALRSSRAALTEHIAGTETALRAYGLPPSAKAQASGNVLARTSELADLGPPQIDLDCPVPPWLADTGAWRAACLNDAATYQQILDCAATISDARERAKAAQLEQLAARHRLVLAFDKHPITLAAIDRQLQPAGLTVLIATGETYKTRREVEKLFARDSHAKAIALCSDALNEGLNLQGAAALVHLDLPTTLRAAEQRVGRVDRMDSPHDRITVLWPRDGPAFAAREAELLTARRDTSEALLGSNLPLPAFGSPLDDAIISVERQIRDFDHPDLTWDGIRDAFEPVRRLVTGEHAIIPAETYAEHRHTKQRVMARVAPVAADSPWAFLAMSGTKHGAPRWLILEGDPLQPAVGIEAVAERLRAHLQDNPPNVDFDETCERWLDRFLAAAAQAENRLLPRRMQRALDQMKHMTRAWGNQAARNGDQDTAEQCWRLSGVAAGTSDDDRLDPYVVGEVWWDQVRPQFADLRHGRRRRRYARLRDLDTTLLQHPIDLKAIQAALLRAPTIDPVDRRISAAIIGIPQPTP